MLPPSVSKLEKSPICGKAPKEQADVERNNSVLKYWKLRKSEKWETV